MYTGIIIGTVLAVLVVLSAVFTIIVASKSSQRREAAEQLLQQRQRQHRRSLAPSYRSARQVAQPRRTSALVSPPPKYTQLAPPGSDYSSEPSSIASTPERVHGYPAGYTWDSSTEPPPTASTDGSGIDSPAGSAGNAGGPGEEEGHSYFTFFRDDQETTGQPLPQLSPEIVADAADDASASNPFHTVV